MEKPANDRDLKETTQLHERLLRMAGYRTRTERTGGGMRIYAIPKAPEVDDVSDIGNGETPTVGG